MMSSYICEFSRAAYIILRTLDRGVKGKSEKKKKKHTPCWILIYSCGRNVSNAISTNYTSYIKRIPVDNRTHQHHFNLKRKWLQIRFLPLWQGVATLR
jgi:hypothetical protein